MNRIVAVVVGLILLLLLVLFSTTYSVAYHEVAIKTTLGRTGSNSVVRDAGLKFRLPFFIDRVEKYDTRLQLLETAREEIPVADDQSVVVQAFLMWQVQKQDDGPIEFHQKYGSIEEANRRLESQVRSVVKATLGGYSFNQLIGPDSRLAEAEQAILDALRSRPLDGVEPVRVGISQFVLPPRTTSFVQRRMEATRKVLAESIRSEGNAIASGIDSEARNKEQRILAFASARAAAIRATANTQVAEYMARLAQDEDLAIFLYWIDALKESLSNNTTFLLDGRSAPWHLLNNAAPRSASGIPLPDQPFAAGAGEDAEAERVAGQGQ